MLHVACCAAGHYFAAVLGLWLTRGARAHVPPPHVTEHSDQPAHANTQSCAHACPLQSRVCGRGRAALGPWAGTDTTALRVWPPPPQLLVHAPHGPHSYTQSAGHASVLHGRVSGAGHGRPSSLGSRAICGARDCAPPAHEALHSEEEP